MSCRDPATPRLFGVGYIVTESTGSDDNDPTSVTHDPPTSMRRGQIVTQSAIRDEIDILAEQSVKLVIKL